MCTAEDICECICEVICSEEMCECCLETFCECIKSCCKVLPEEAQICSVLLVVVMALSLYFFDFGAPDVWESDGWFLGYHAWQCCLLGLFVLGICGCILQGQELERQQKRQQMYRQPFVERDI